MIDILKTTNLFATRRTLGRTERRVDENLRRFQCGQARAAQELRA
jgi:hypothetical protein